MYLLNIFSSISYTILIKKIFVSKLILNIIRLYFRSRTSCCLNLLIKNMKFCLGTETPRNCFSEKERAVLIREYRSGIEKKAVVNFSATTRNKSYMKKHTSNKQLFCSYANRLGSPWRIGRITRLWNIQTWIIYPIKMVFYNGIIW